MTAWCVELIGDAHDLEEVPYFFPTGDVRCTQEENTFLLYAIEFDRLAEPAEVYDRAEELIDDVAGALAVHIGRFPRPQLGAVRQLQTDGSFRRHHVLKAKMGSVYSRLRIGGPPSGPTYPQLFFQAGQRSEHLRYAMLLWADQNRTWPRLYRILEEVEQHLGTSAHKRGLCTKTNQTRFERTANSAEVAGKDARHALRRNVPPAHPMTLEEAVQFIGAMLQGALRLAAAESAA